MIEDEVVCYDQNDACIIPSADANSCRDGTDFGPRFNTFEIIFFSSTGRTNRCNISRIRESH